MCLLKLAHGLFLGMKCNPLLANWANYEGLALGTTSNKQVAGCKSLSLK